MQTYEIIGHSVILGVGLTLKLTKEQAVIRVLSLKQKKKDIYTVIEPIQFKKGEIVSIISGNVSKSVLKNLSENKEISDQSKNNVKNLNKNQKSKIDYKESINSVVPT